MRTAKKEGLERRSKQESSGLGQRNDNLYSSIFSTLSWPYGIETDTIQNCSVSGFSTQDCRIVKQY
jgi:hypothetical protein